MSCSEFDPFGVCLTQTTVKQNELLWSFQRLSACPGQEFLDGLWQAGIISTVIRSRLRGCLVPIIGNSQLSKLDFAQPLFFNVGSALFELFSTLPLLDSLKYALSKIPTPMCHAPSPDGAAC